MSETENPEQEPQPVTTEETPQTQEQQASANPQNPTNEN